MFKACSKCGKIHDYCYKCNVNKPVRRFESNEETRARSTSKWQKKRKYIKDSAFNLCEVCKDNGIYNYDDLEIHHIVKLKNNPDGLLINNNLICLCVSHHKQADAGLLAIDYLQTLAEKREAGENQ